MPLLLLPPGVSVGDPTFDADHELMFQLMNLIHDLVRAERVGGARLAAEALRTHAGLHFQREEQELAANSYPRLVGHRDEHRAFLTMLDRLIGDLADGCGQAATGIEQLMLYKLECLINSDMDYGWYFAEVCRVETRAAPS